MKLLYYLPAFGGPNLGYKIKILHYNIHSIFNQTKSRNIMFVAVYSYYMDIIVFNTSLYLAHAKKYVKAVSQSGLFFANDELSRIEDRQDKFARRIFVTQLWDPRARVPLHEFRLFRAYIFGVFIRPGRDSESGGLASYPCLIVNKKGDTCGLRCDPFGHGAFLCKCTSRTSDHNHARDIITSMTQAFEFISTKEVVIAPWEKKPDVEVVDPKGDFLNIYLDITLPALFQQAVTSRKAVYDAARRAKSKSYPHKDLQGRLLNTSSCLPFILSTMGGLCKEGHEFFRICQKRSPINADHMQDVLVTQHSRWTARRVHRALFGQCLINFLGSSWTPEACLSGSCQHLKKGQTADPGKSQLTFKRLATAYQSTLEDHSQSSNVNSHHATPQTTEFFELSPH